MGQSPPPVRSTDISIRALLVAGSLCLLALWWSLPRHDLDLKLRAEGSHMLRPEPQSMPDIHLPGVHGEFNLDSLRGRWTLLFFAHSRCPDKCSTSLSGLGVLHRALAATADTHSLQTYVVSVDIDDDPLRIQDFASNFDNSFLGFAGAWDEREKLFLFFDVGVDLNPEDGPNLMSHSHGIYLIDPEAHHVATWLRLPHQETFRREICSFLNCQN